jgi:hypothetical protein
MGARAGSAYVFDRDDSGAWSQTQKLTASDAAVGHQYGVAVDIWEGTIVVGAYSHNWNETVLESGAAYVYTKRLDSDEPWVEQAQLIPTDVAAGDYFGVSVAIHKDRVVCGSDSDGDNGEGSGSAYVFSRNSDGVWTEEAKLVAEDGAEFDKFGSCVDIRDNTVLVGAYGEEPALALNDTREGAAYIFTTHSDIFAPNSAGEWTQRAKLTAHVRTPGAEFGRVVSLGDGMAVMGAHLEESIYIFTRSGNGTWGNDNQVQLKAPDPFDGEYFGYAAALDGNELVVGAYLHQKEWRIGGAVYLFSLFQNGGDDTTPVPLTPAPSTAATLLPVATNVPITSSPGLTDPPMQGGSPPPVTTNVPATSPTGLTGPPIPGGSPPPVATNAPATSPPGLTDPPTPGGSPPPVATNAPATSPPGLTDHSTPGGSPPPSPLLPPVATSAPGSSPSGLTDPPTPGGTSSPSASLPPVATNAPGSSPPGLTDPSTPGGTSSPSASLPPVATNAPGSSPPGLTDPPTPGGTLPPSSSRPLRHDYQYLQPKGISNDHFGASVFKSGNSVILGAPLKDSGVAYIYWYKTESNQWYYEGTATPPNARDYSSFGATVAMVGEAAIVGALYFNDITNEAGSSVHVFLWDSIVGQWSRTQTLLLVGDSSIARTSDDSMAIDVWNDILIVGGLGVVGVYRKAADQWTEEAKIPVVFENDGTSNSKFARAVSIHQDTFVCSNGAGSVYVYTRNGGTWEEQTKLVAEDVVVGDQFGVSVAVHEDTVIVGASKHNLSTGAAYIFRRQETRRKLSMRQRGRSVAASWTQTDKLTATDASPGDEFGTAVMIDSEVAVAGAPMTESVYIFRRSGNGSFVPETKVSSPTLKGGSQFGASLDLDGRDLLVGAHLHRRGSSRVEAGSAFLYHLQEPVAKVQVHGAFIAAIEEVNAGDDKTATSNSSSMAAFATSSKISSSAAPTLSPDIPPTTSPETKENEILSSPIHFPYDETTTILTSSDAENTSHESFDDGATTPDGSTEATGREDTSSSAAADFLVTLLGSTFVSLLF